MQCVLPHRKQRCFTWEGQHIIFPLLSFNAIAIIVLGRVGYNVSDKGAHCQDGSSSIGTDIFTFDFVPFNPFWPCIGKTSFLASMIFFMVHHLAHAHLKNLLQPFLNPLACGHLLFVSWYRAMPKSPRILLHCHLLVYGLLFHCL